MKLTPAPPFDASRLKQWIADLGSDQFAVRDVASKELAKIAERIEPALRRALAAATSAEIKRRLQTLLDSLSPARSEECLRAARGLAVLEQIGTPEARKVLETLAAGDPDAALTLEAKATLRRLENR